MSGGWHAAKTRFTELIRRLRERGQSETLGVALLTGIVVILVATTGLFLFADFSANDEEQLLANINGEVEATNITLDHEGGDTFEPENVEIVLTGDTTAEYTLGTDFTEIDGGTGTLEPGDTWRNEVSDIILGTGRLLVVHEPTNTVLLDTPYSVETVEQGVTFLMTDWESGPDSEPDNTDETTIYSGEDWNYSVRAQFPDGSALSVDPANVSFETLDRSKLEPTGSGELEAKDNGTVLANVTVDRPGIDDFDEMEIRILDSKPTLTITNVSAGPASGGSAVQSNQVGTSAADVGTANSDKIMEGDDVAIEVEVEPTADDVEVSGDVSVNIPWSNDNKTRELEDIGGPTNVIFKAPTDETENPAETGWIGSAGVYSDVTAETDSGSMTANEVKVHGRAFYNVSITDTNLSILEIPLLGLNEFSIDFGAEITVTNIGHVDGTGASVDFSGTSAGGNILDGLSNESDLGGLAATPLTQDDTPATDRTHEFNVTYSPGLLSGILGDTLNMTANVSGVDADNDSESLPLEPTNYNVTISRIDPNPVAEGDSFEVEVEVNANSNADPIDTLELNTDGLDGTPTESNVPVGESRNFTVDTSAGDADTNNYSIEATAKVDTGITGISGKEVNDTTAEVAVNAPAQFDITGIEANPDAVDLDANESFNVTYNVTNTGGVTDTQFINFTVDNGTDTVYTNNGSVEVTLDPGEFNNSISPFSYTPEDTDRLRVNATVSSADDSNTRQVDVPYNVSFTVDVPDFGVNASDSTDMYANGSLSSMSLGSSGFLGGSMLYSGHSPAAGLYAAAPDAVRTGDNETDRGSNGGDSSSDGSVLKPDTIGTQSHFDPPVDDVQAGMTFTRPAEPGQGVVYDGSPGSEEPYELDVSGLDRVAVELEGAGGGGGAEDGDGGFAGGAGGKIKAMIDVSEFTALEVYVGEGGNSGSGAPTKTGTSEGGWGYENGGKGSEDGCAFSCGGGGGGGSSAILGIDSNGDKTWIVTAGGGGGGLALDSDGRKSYAGGGGGGDGEGGNGVGNIECVPVFGCSQIPGADGDGEDGILKNTMNTPGGYPGGDGGDKDDSDLGGEDGNATYSDYVIDSSVTLKEGGAFNGGDGGIPRQAQDGGDGRVAVYSLPQLVDVSNTDFIEVALDGPGGGASGPIADGGVFGFAYNPKYAGGGNGGNVTAVINVSEFDTLEMFVGEGGEGAERNPTVVGQTNLMTDFRPIDNGDPSDAYQGQGGFGGVDGGHGGLDGASTFGDFISSNATVKGGGGGGSTEIRAGDGTTLVVAGGGGGGARDRDGPVGDSGCFLEGLVGSGDGTGECGYGGGGGAPGGNGGISEDWNDNGNERGENVSGISGIGGDGQAWDNANAAGLDGDSWVNPDYGRVIDSNKGGGGVGGKKEDCGGFLGGIAGCSNTPGEKGEDGKIEIRQTYSTPDPGDNKIYLNRTDKQLLELELNGSGGAGGFKTSGGDGARLEVRLNVTELRNTFGDVLYYWNGMGGTYEGSSDGNGGTGLLPGGDGEKFAGGGGGSTEVRGEPGLTGALVAAADAGGGGGTDKGGGNGAVQTSGGGGAAGGAGEGTAEDAHDRPDAASEGGDGGGVGEDGSPGGYVINSTADYVEAVLVNKNGGAENGGSKKEDGGDGSVVYNFINKSGAELSDLDIAGQGDNASITFGNDTDVSVNVTNNGGITSDFTVYLNISNGTATPVQRDELVSDLAPSETETVTFSGVTDGLDPDEYDVNVSTSADSLSGNLEVTVDPSDFDLMLTDVPDQIEEGANLTIEYTIESFASYNATADEVQLNITGLGNENPVATVSNVTVPAGGETTEKITFTDTQTIRSLAAAGLVTIAESDADNATEARPPVVAP